MYIRTSGSNARRVRSRGFTLIEILLGASMLALFIVSIALYYRKALEVSQETTHHIQAGFLLEEGIEAVKSMRDDGWTTYIATLNPGTSYYLYWNGSKWRATTTPLQVENTFWRSVILSSVNRDVNDDIVTTGGSADAGTRKVRVDVTWNKKTASSTESIETYITNLFNN
ncbi:MAG TPA: hypothetical protein VLB83_04575 [Candidatus Paceibacterota bacterium]|nr:hypothetical protein [Candidatus Paceibacterota bacterium]